MLYQNSLRIFTVRNKQTNSIMKNTNTATATAKKIEMVQWGELNVVTSTMTSIEALEESKLIEKIAENFGMEHLVKREISRIKDGSCKYKTFFKVDADPKLNYGLDFKLFMLYTIDGMTFFKEFSFSSSITSRPLQRVMLNTLTPKGLDFGDLDSVTKNPELLREWARNNEKNIISSFQYATNVFYKKDMKYRTRLKELCTKYNFIFA